MNSKNILFYHTFNSPYNSITIVWNSENSKLKIQRIFLSNDELNSEENAFQVFKRSLEKGNNSEISNLKEKILKFLRGKEVFFGLELLNMNRCFQTQKMVLLAEYKVPRGWITTYKRIAIKIGIPMGARVVGNSLARNPFPIIIPCHRAIKSNGELGGFQGGIEMKRALLEKEGLKIVRKGKIITENIYY
jgi:methylated-DNA-[protein]-cysteine S-methyltransferase